MEQEQQRASSVGPQHDTSLHSNQQSVQQNGVSNQQPTQQQPHQSEQETSGTVIRNQGVRTMTIAGTITSSPENHLPTPSPPEQHTYIEQTKNMEYGYKLNEIHRTPPIGNYEKILSGHYVHGTYPVQEVAGARFTPNSYYGNPVHVNFECDKINGQDGTSSYVTLETVGYAAGPHQGGGNTATTIYTTAAQHDQYQQYSHVGQHKEDIKGVCIKNEVCDPMGGKHEHYRVQHHTQLQPGQLYEHVPASSHQQMGIRRAGVSCANCNTTTTPKWIRIKTGEPLCSACNVYYRRNGVNRPLRLKVLARKKEQRNTQSNSPKHDGKDKDLLDMEQEQQRASSVGPQHDTSLHSNQQSVQQNGVSNQQPAQQQPHQSEQETSGTVIRNHGVGTITTAGTITTSPENHEPTPSPPEQHTYIEQTKNMEYGYKLNEIHRTKPIGNYEKILSGNYVHGTYPVQEVAGARFTPNSYYGNPVHVNFECDKINGQDGTSSYVTLETVGYAAGPHQGGGNTATTIYTTAAQHDGYQQYSHVGQHKEDVKGVCFKNEVCDPMGGKHAHYHVQHHTQLQPEQQYEHVPASSHQQMGNRRAEVTCTNCNIDTRKWCRNDTGEPVCNACYLYYRKYGVNRPLRLKVLARKREQRNTQSNSPKHDGKDKMGNRRAEVSCANCNITTTPRWITNKTGEPVCNACYAYYRRNGVNRPLRLKVLARNREQRNTQINSPKYDGKDKMGNRRAEVSCANCNTTTTTLWRRNNTGEPLCNACYVYYRTNGVNRPLRLKILARKREQRNTQSNSPKHDGIYSCM